MTKAHKIILNGKPISTNNLYKTFGDVTTMVPRAKQLRTCYMAQIEQQFRAPILKRKVKIDLYLFLPDTTKRDIDNYNKLILDCLSGIVYKDDKQIHLLNISKMTDRKHPRAEVIITEI